MHNTHVVSCQVCGAEFNTSRPTMAQYCSPRCKNLGGLAKLPARKCAVCGKEYVPTYRKQWFCSRRCSVSTKPSPTYTLSCEICGTVFVTGQPWTKFCSCRCKSRAARNRIPRRKCLACGKKYKPSSRRQQFCSRACSTANTIPTKLQTCIRCGTEFQFHGRTRCLYCKVCRKIVDREKGRSWALAHGVIKHPGVGSGGAQMGEANHQWRGGHRKIFYTTNYRRTCFRLWGRQCVVCGKCDEVAVHHVDGDPSNYFYDNLVPLCPGCHKQVHSKRRQTKRQLTAVLNKLWPNCRSKIAEKIGEALRNGVIRPEDPRLKPGSWSTTS